MWSHDIKVETVATKGKHRNYRISRILRGIGLRYLRWQNQHMPQGVLLIIIAVLTGVLSGIAAAALKDTIRLIRIAVIGTVNLKSPDLRYLVWPVVGILLTSMFQRYVARTNVARGTSIISQDLQTGHYKMNPFWIFNPLLGCALTIGFGASAGSEGPTALSGSAIGSAVGRWFRLSKGWSRLLLGIGAGAGIAAIFKSPIGGVLFTLEVLHMQMTTLPVIALVLACMLSSITAYMLGNFTFDIFFDRTMAFDPHMTGWVILLGAFCGLYSILYNRIKVTTAGWFGKIKNPWVAALVTGGVLSIFTFMFPSFYGEGFGVITSLVNGEQYSFTSAGLFAGKDGFWWMIIALAAILLLKGMMVSASYSGGGVAGDFVPTLFAGALAGYLFATLCNTWFHCMLPEWFFALVGMGAVMAGTIHAPLMATFILCETTNTFGYIMPYLVAVGVSYAVVKMITPNSWYDGTGHDDVLDLLKLHDTPNLRRSVANRTPVKTADSTPQDQKQQ